MNRKTILVLGASLYQVDTIKTAKRLGLRVITTDNVPTNPGHALADKSDNIDTTDLEGVLSLAIREQVDGIIAPCTDIALPTAAYVASKLNRPGSPYESALIVTDKESFRGFLRNHSIPMPETFSITPSFRPKAQLFERGTWIMKPDQSSGAKGVFIIQSQADYEAHIGETLSFSRQRRGVLERYIHGFQGTCEGILLQGEIAAAFFLDRQTAAPPYVTTCGHHVPTLLPANTRAAVFARIAELWNLLGVTEGPFDCDFVVGPDEVYIIEMSPRIGGNLISALLLAASGFDIVEYSVLQACGERLPFPPTLVLSPTAVVIFGTEGDGQLAFDDRELNLLRHEPWIESISMDYELGTAVHAFTNGRHRVGQALVRAEDRQSVDDRIREIGGRLKVRAI